MYGYWIRPNGEYEKITHAEHILDIKMNPEKFGLTKEFVEENDRDDVIKEVAKNGWIRVRNHRTRGGYTLSVEFHKWSSKARKNVENLLMDLIAKKEVKSYNEVVYASYTEGVIERFYIDEWLRKNENIKEKIKLKKLLIESKTDIFMKDKGFMLP